MIRITEEDQSATDVTLRIEGRVVTGTAESLERICNSHLHAGRHPHLDLSSVTCVDARGAAALIRMEDSGADMACLSALVRDLLEERRGETALGIDSPPNGVRRGERRCHDGVATQESRAPSNKRAPQHREDSKL